MKTPKESYEEWEKIANLHEAYGKHDYPDSDALGWNNVAICKICGMVKPRWGKGLNAHNIFSMDNATSMEALNKGGYRHYVLKYMTPLLDGLQTGYATRMLRHVTDEELQWLFENGGPGLTAVELANRVGPKESLHDFALKSPTASLQYAQAHGKDDALRLAASAIPTIAMLYATGVDKSYHEVTRQSALKHSASGVTYVQNFGDQFKITEPERKRLVKTLVGAYHVANAMGDDREEYRKKLCKSTYYGFNYIMDVAGEPIKEFEHSTRISHGSDCLMYTAAFRKDMRAKDGDGYPSCPLQRCNSERYAGLVADGYVACMDIIAEKGGITEDVIKAMPYRKRSWMAAGYCLATNSYSGYIKETAERNRHYGYICSNYIFVIKRINNARARKGTPLIQHSF